MAAAKKILMICGDCMEDYESFNVFQMLEGLGYKVDAVCPDKVAGDKCATVVHDFRGDQTYMEDAGHSFTLTADFSAAVAAADSYDGLYCPGGRGAEYLALNSDVRAVVKSFFAANKPVASICHGQQILAAAGVLSGRAGTAYPACRAQCMSSGLKKWIAPDPITMAHTDGNYVSAAAWPAHPELVAQFVKVLGGEISGPKKRILALVGDFAEDLELMVAYQGLLAMGHTVECVCPDKKAGDKIKTCVHDFTNLQTYTESRGHDFGITATFDDVASDVSQWDALIIPGGRSAEYQAQDDRVIALVKSFFSADKACACIGHGQLILAAADVLQGRKLTCYPTVQFAVQSAGGEYVAVEPASECVTDKNLVTSTSWAGGAELLKQFAAVLDTKISI